MAARIVDRHVRPCSCSVVTPAALATFLSEPYRIGQQRDRMGIRLDGPPLRGEMIPRHDFRPADLPTVMRKAWDLARAELTPPPGV